NFYLNLENEKKLRKGVLLYSLTLLLFILSCLSKSMAVSFPLVILLTHMWLHQRHSPGNFRSFLNVIFSRKMILLLLPFFAVSLFFGVLAIEINNPNSFSFINRIHYAGYGFTMYLVRFLVPFSLSPLYPYPSAFVHYEGFSAFVMGAGVLVFALTLLFAIMAFRKYPEVTFGTGFFIASVIIVLQLISVGAAIMADRYTYLAYAGLAFIPAFAIERLGRNLRMASYALSMVFVITLSVISSRQADVWSNSETLWTRVLKFFPYDETARSIRGIYYMKMSGRSTDEGTKRMFEAKALADFNHSIKAGTARADVWESAGIIYAGKARSDSALLCLDKALDLRPDKGSAYYNRALVRAMSGKTGDAIADYTLALRHQPENALKILNNRSNLYLEAGMFSEAVRDLDYLITRERDNYIYYSSRGYARMMIKDISGAVTDFVRALELNPDDAESRRQLNAILSAGAK
nr:tetratricopeptide repeat protein [Bacteroidales bacterium]